MNLSAPFICKRFRGKLLAAARQAQVVLGNRLELAALWEAEQEEQKVKQKVEQTEGQKVEEQAAWLVRKVFTCPHQRLVVTGGASPTLLASSALSAGLLWLPVPQVAPTPTITPPTCPASPTAPSAARWLRMR